MQGFTTWRFGTGPMKPWEADKLMKNMNAHSFAYLLNSRLGSMPKGPALDPFEGPNIERMFADPGIAFAEDETEENETEESTSNGRSFTQADVDKIVKNRLRKAERELASAQKRAESSEAKLNDMQSKLDELDDKLNVANKSDEAKELAKLQRKHAQLEEQFKRIATERDEAIQRAEEASTGLTKHKVSTTLTDALLNAGAYKKGVKRAVEAMRSEGIVQLDDDGNMIVTVGGVPYDNPAEAAKRWLSLEENEMFAEGIARGAGTPRSGGNGLVSPKQMDEMRTGSLLQLGLSQPPSK